MRRPGPALVAIAWAALAACSRAAPSNASGETLGEAPVEEGPEVAMDPREAQAWAHAVDGGEEERMRLADLVGCPGLREHSMNPGFRATAIRSAAYCGDFSELPWLARLGAGADADAAEAALEAIVEQAARPRAATDPDDAFELGQGCAALDAIARDRAVPRTRRVLAVRALRMLGDRGCPKVDAGIMGHGP